MRKIAFDGGKLLIARYGAFGLDGGITDFGVQQISNIALSLRKIIRDAEVTIFHHPWRGASDSAAIFKKNICNAACCPCDLLELGQFSNTENRLRKFVRRISRNLKSGKTVVALCPFDFLWLFASFLPQLTGHKCLNLRQDEINELRIWNHKALFVDLGLWRAKILPENNMSPNLF